MRTKSPLNFAAGQLLEISKAAVGVNVALVQLSLTAPTNVWA